MIARCIVSFVAGMAFASAWWCSFTVEKTAIIAATLMTVVLVCVAGRALVENWEVKR